LGSAKVAATTLHAYAIRFTLYATQHHCSMYLLE
jgi:hypothetical protein